MNEQDKMEKMDYKFINAMTNQIKINNITQEKSRPWTNEAKAEHIENLANLSVPPEYRARYKALLVKHFDAITIRRSH